MTECKTWRQVDEKHFRPLCSNIFVPETGNDSCSACAVPQEFFGGCTGVDNCTGFRAKKSLVLDIRTDLTEAAHVYPRTQGSGTVFFGPGGTIPVSYDMEWYDQYADAADIGAPCVLEASNWNPTGFNTGCAWVSQQLYRRHFKRTTTTVTISGRSHNTDTLVFTDIDLNGPGPYTSPYSCSGLFQECTSIDWGWRWTFRIADNSIGSGQIAATLLLERLVSRHMIRNYDDSTAYGGIVTAFIPSSSLPVWGDINDRAMAPNVPSIVGVGLGPPGLVSTRFGGFPSRTLLPATSLGVEYIGTWATPTGVDMCNKPRPWVLQKTFDAIDGKPANGGVPAETSYNSITNLPNEIKIDVGLF
jgi:hypothetical protein